MATRSTMNSVYGRLSLGCLARQSQILDEANAIAVFQLSFTDLDLGSFPKPVPTILPLFATLGLVDSNLRPKPALTTWDKIFTRPLRR